LLRVVIGRLRHIVKINEDLCWGFRRRTTESLVLGSVFRIRIGSGFNQVNGSGSVSSRAKVTHKDRKKLRNFMF
jgi:hypothetical protein